MVGSDRGFSGRRLVHLTGVVALCAMVAACAIGPRKRPSSHTIPPSHTISSRDTVAVGQETPREEEKPLVLPLEDVNREEAVVEAVVETVARAPTLFGIPEEKSLPVMTESSADVLPVPAPPPVFARSVSAMPVSAMDESLVHMEKTPVAALHVHGLEDKSVRALLGEPGLLRRDPPAEVWQYPVSTAWRIYFFMRTGTRNGFPMCRCDP
ncbi:MAG: hypothetical protein FD149_1159 [Rhodospirillaceae bacterium]|nr:MAG: hypothetical protein FD149_1159 [Rhodospirillaceae bacterium]